MVTRKTKKASPDGTSGPETEPDTGPAATQGANEAPPVDEASAALSAQTLSPNGQEDAPGTPATASADLAVDGRPPANQLRRKDFVDSVAARSGRKRSEARVIAEAALDVLAEALAQGKEIILPPLGRIRVLKTKDGPRMRILTLRLQQMSEPGENDDGHRAEGPADEGLADTGDTG